jgi:hypothetical protein
VLVREKSKRGKGRKKERNKKLMVFCEKKRIRMIIDVTLQMKEKKGKEKSKKE